jgi:hypothetical protein
MTRPLIPFAVERWFTEFEFVTGMQNLAASGAYPPTTQEALPDRRRWPQPDGYAGRRRDRILRLLDRDHA